MMNFSNIRNLICLSTCLGMVFLSSSNLVFADTGIKNEITKNTNQKMDLSRFYSKKPEFKPGFFLKERKALYEKIMLAEKNGVGVKHYLTAFKYIETMVEKGAKQEEVAKRIDSLARGLDDQLKRSKILKIQKLPPPIAASSPPPSAVRSKSRSSSASKLNKNDLYKKIKDNWFGGNIPPSIKNRIPAGVDPSKLSKSDIDKLMKRLGK